MPHPQVESVAERADAHVTDTVRRLEGYLRIPAISCQEEHASDVGELAERVRRDLEALGLARCRLLELDGALPAVAAEHLQAGPDAPTVLVYGHLDLQPVELEHWKSPPHEPVERDGRLYARGSADDMGGWVSHLAAIEAWLSECGELPCNLKLLIEGEEEIGSPNLERYMDAFPEAFEADVMVLTDCENPSTEVPGLTVSLRGLVEVELVVRALDADVHSGLWGGAVPDVSIALCQLIASMVDEDGRMTIGRVPVPEAWREQARRVPLDDETVRKGAHLVDGVEPLPDRDRPRAEWLWRQPAMTVVATTLPTPERKKNALRREARATLSVRLPPDLSPEEMVASIRETVLHDPPGGVQVELREGGWAGTGWLYEPSGPAFEAADRAYEKSWGGPLVQVGVGGSIPFVALFGRRFGDLPLILNGVMDPQTTAHGPNESMDLGVFRKAVLANVHLYDELGALGRQALRTA